MMRVYVAVVALWAAASVAVSAWAAASVSILALGLALGLAGCSAPEHRVELAIELATDGPACTALGEVRVISVELLGIADGQPCSLGKRCVFDVGTLEDVDDVAALLAEANQPLVDVADDDAHTVAVIGHRESCWGTDDHAMCGYADLAEVQDGVLAVPVSCTACPDDEIRFCP
jgi:hypothetical protein